MKRKKRKIGTFDYSPIALRALVRHPYAPPTKFYKDRKRASAIKRCRTQIRNITTHDD